MNILQTIRELKRFVVISRNTYSHQGRGAWCNIQIGYTNILLLNMWQRDKNKTAWLDIFLCAPSHNMQYGYVRAHTGFTICLPWLLFWRRPQRLYPMHIFRFWLFAGSHGYAVPAWMRWVPRRLYVRT